MNLRSNPGLGLLAASLLVWADAACAQETNPSLSKIILNGVMAGLGDKRAFFKVTFTDGAPPANLMLTEGQEKFGIELLAVDMRLNVTTIREHGFTRTISICPTPKLMALQTTNGTTINWELPVSPGGSIDRMVSAGDPSKKMNGAALNTVGSGDSAKTPANNAAASANNNADQASSSDGSITAASAPEEHLYQWWVKEAEKIERARVETAQRVMAGEWQPYPLTPLTPPGTPAPLIGDGSAFMDHGPGIVLNGN